MLRAIAWTYLVISLAMISTSLITGHRATALSGKPHYMFTRTTVSVDEDVPSDSAADVARQQALREAGVSTVLPVDEPCFVLGFADATGPIVVLGGAIVLIAWAWKRWRGRPRAVGRTGPGQV